MQIMKTIVVFFVLFCSIATFGLSCPSCGQSMLVTDQFCPNCGKEKNVESPKSMPRPYPSQVPMRRPFVESSKSYTLQSSHVPTYRTEASCDSSRGIVARLSGMGRGLVTVTFSPLNFFRGAAHGVKWISKTRATDGYVASGMLVVGTVTGTFAVVADIVNGSIDFASVGYYGDLLYDSPASRHPTPWIWERDWAANKFPWIDRK